MRRLSARQVHPRVQVEGIFVTEEYWLRIPGHERRPKSMYATSTVQPRKKHFTDETIWIVLAGLSPIDVVTHAGITYSRPSSKMGEETRRDPPNSPFKLVRPYRRRRVRPRSAPHAAGGKRAGGAHSPRGTARLGIQYPR